MSPRSVGAMPQFGYAQPALARTKGIKDDTVILRSL